MAEVEGGGERTSHCRLAKARDALQQRVAADCQADQHSPDRLVLADDGLGDGRLDRATDPLELLWLHGLEPLALAGAGASSGVAVTSAPRPLDRLRG